MNIAQRIVKRLYPNHNTIVFFYQFIYQTERFTNKSLFTFDIYHRVSIAMVLLPLK